MVITKPKLKKTPSFKFIEIEGVDMQRFNRTSVDEKAKIIPTKLLEEIQLGEYASIFSDQHLLANNKGIKFVCAKINGLSECMSGIDH